MMKLAYLGTGDFAVPALEALVKAGHEIVVVISQPDRPSGRGKKIRPTPVHAAADELGLRHIQAEDINTLDYDATFRDAQLGVVAAFGQKIGNAILAKLPNGCVNIHGSLLPKYRGAAPFQWAVINGEVETGVTVFQLDEKWDNGPVYGMNKTPIGEAETADELHDRLAALGAELIPQIVAKIEAGSAEPMVQDHSLACRAPKFKRSDGVVDWSEPAAKIARRIHGMWSWPTVSCQFSSQVGKVERVSLARVAVADAEALPTDSVPAGMIREDGCVQTGCGTIKILQMKPAGKKLMDFDAFVNGRHVKPGDRFLPLDEA